MYPDLSKKIETGLTTPKFCSIPSPSFIDSWKEIKNDNLSDRRLYYYLLNIENFFPILSCAWEKATAVLYKVQDYSLNSENSLFSRKNGIFSLKNSSELNFFRESVQHFFPVNFDTRDEPDFLFYIINHYSPFALIDGSWLSGAVSLAHAHYRYGGTLLKIHSKKVGNGSLENNHSLAFRQMARNIKLDFFPIFSWEYAFEQSRSNYAYTLPVFLLSLSQFPGLLMPEILGVNLLLSLFDVPLFSNLVETSLTSIDKNFLHMKRNYQCEYINLSIDAITEYISFISDSCDVEYICYRINNAFFKTFIMIKAFYDRLSKEISSLHTFSIETKIYKIFEKIGTKASGYHKRGELGGKQLDDWFLGHSSPAELLSALAKSRYIKPGQPEKSPFIHQISSPKGAMFRIFTDDEILLFKEWIKNLEHRESNTYLQQMDFRGGIKRNGPRSLQIVNEQAKSIDKNSVEGYQSTPDLINQEVFPSSFLEKLKIQVDKYVHCTLAELYYYLIHVDQYPDVLPTAKKFALEWIEESKLYLLKKSQGIPFKIYTHEKLESWLSKKHKEQVDSYIPLEGSPDETKEELIQATINLSPLTYIDGAWIRKMSDPTIVNTHVGGLLYNIYVDELGNGDVEIHHGNIFRSLISQMKVDLPHFDSPEFPKNFFDEKYLRLPVYWLSISCFPKSFFPEILGLNLAMELAGIGGEYRRSGDVLRYYGFSPQFTILHNTIDNIVSGHTAWAMKAIKLHLDQIMQTDGRVAVDAHWFRIWIGYLSLTLPNQKKWFSPYKKISKFLNPFKKK